ncbi:cold shock domain-containing Unr [Arctopsyche grandis]|uniref:cold shock domain-containing Unr n=1 Tax=Arctopsyche grandis TaxID=121162 RepID=UPI00406D9B86
MSSNSQWKSFQQSKTSTKDIHNLQQVKPILRNGNEFLKTSKKEFSNTESTSSGGRAAMGGFKLDNFKRNDSPNSHGNSSQSSQQYDPPNQPNRETGIIEKLLHSYGFIQCCERQARLFFHFSQFSGNIEHLKIGDPVEFEMTYDRRTGKPIASTVTKIAPEVVLSEARVTGTVTTELRGDGLGDSTGRISYENRGECFFLPYTKDDVEGNVNLGSGDTVSFQIATNQRGNLGACHIRLENPVHPVKYQGVVCSMKESFGFIERADVVKEIFFHFSEAKTKNNLNLGDDVEFVIQTRNGKEVACSITRLQNGSVVFEDVCADIIKGQVLKPLERGNSARQQTDPLPGRIRHRASDHSEVDVPFGDKDQNGDFTLRHGDWVKFQVATDRRDQLKRATNISLLDESFHVSGEKRERGIVSMLKDGFGFIKCVERESLLFFHFAEVLSMNQTLNVGDEIEYTVDPAAGFSNSRPSAIRIKHLPLGSVQFEVILEKNIQGIVLKEVTLPINSLLKTTQEANGLISYQLNGMRKTVPYYVKDIIGKKLPRDGDKVIFNICQIKRTKEVVGMRVMVKRSHDSYSNGSRTMLQGFIAVLKDGFGFIESKERDKEIYFHFSNFQGNIDTLELGREVEYFMGNQAAPPGGCNSAELVRVLPKGSLLQPVATDEIVEGVVTRPIRALNLEQPIYTGLIETHNGLRFEFGIMSLACKRANLRFGDAVIFQTDVEDRATNITSCVRKRRATVDFAKSSYGFLSHQLEDGKKLIYYSNEVCASSNPLHPGDVVEFILFKNQRNGKVSACNLTKISAYDRCNDTETGRDGDYFHKQSPDHLDLSGSSAGHHGYDYQSYHSYQSYSGNSRSYRDYDQSSHGYNDTANGGSPDCNFLNLGKRDNSMHIDAQSRSSGMVVIRKKRRSVVESIKGAFGFLSVEIEDGKKVVFHMTEVRNSQNLQPGDTVEYTLVTNQRTGKSSACNITKVNDLSSTTRPERLINRLRTISLEEHAGPRLVVIRKPRGPDGTRGFRPRKLYNPRDSIAEDSK